MKKIAMALLVVFCVSSMAFAWPWSKKSTEEAKGKGVEHKAKMMQKKETHKAKITEKKTIKKETVKKKVMEKKSKEKKVKEKEAK